MTHPLTRYRSDHGLTLQQLGKKLDVHKSTILDWERGAMPRPDLCARIEQETGGEVTAADMVSAAITARTAKSAA
jgi:transcriptional regulator with XRE-family HTH domain